MPSPTRSRREPLYIGLVTLIGLYLAFIEFLPPVRRMHLVGDIDGYHWPLFNYAFQSVKEGRFPLWDPWIYTGLSFFANMQAQLFYPFTWILFAVQWHRVGINFMALQIFTIAHIWVLLQFAYWQLRAGRGLPIGASLIGATVFGFSGYVINDMQHVGVICAVAWLPLALWGVDRGRMWMISLAFTMMFLAGYPATWIACAVAVFTYTLATKLAYTWRASAAVLLSLIAAGIQLIPTAQLAGLRPPEPVYGTGPNLEWQLRRFYPSSIHDPHIYLYYGAGLLLAFALFFWHPEKRRFVAPLALALAGTAFFQNPFHIVSVWATRIPSLADVMQHWNFHIVLSAAAGLFAAHAWAPVAASPKWKWLCFAILPLLWFEQYWFGMRRDEHFRASGNSDRFFAADFRMGGDTIMGVAPEVFRLIRANPAYRIVTDHGPHPTEMRHYRIADPQGFDPFLPARYKTEVEQLGGVFYTNREFEFPPTNEAMLQALAVRYYISAEGRQYYNDLLASPLFRKVAQADDSYFKVFEYRNAQPSYRFAGGEASILKWTPESREFRITATMPSEFVLLEQNLNGWTASIDGSITPIEPYSTAFQRIPTPAGNHVIRFGYEPKALRLGGWCTAFGTLVLAILIFKKF